MLTTVATLKVDFTEGKAKARTPGPSGSLKSSFRNAKKLLYFLAEIKAFWFRLGGNRSKVFACAMMDGVTVRQSSPVPAPGFSYLCSQGVPHMVVYVCKGKVVKSWLSLG